MSSSEDNELILNYQDAVIRVSDLNLLQRPTEWLNDSCIHFFFNRLQQEQPTDLFMDPAVLSFFMHQCTDDEDIEDFVSSTHFPRKKGGKVFIPVNDTMTLGSNAWQLPKSGSHWSLVVATILAQGMVEFWHFDSVRNSGNQQAAQDIADKMGQHIYSLTGRVKVRDASTPSQKNGYDCGIHVLATAQLFSFMGETDDRLEIFESKLQIFVQETPDFCRTLRKSISNDILRLSAEVERK